MARVLSARCFRVVSLLLETQNEVDVLKPVVEELEVLRLSCALGALPSAAPRDFEFELLEARQFDDELARFLRLNVLDGGVTEGGPQVRVGGLFGKQAQVKRQLQRLGAWDDAMDQKLSPRDLGLFAVELPPSSTEVDGIKTLLVFAWLTDDFFHPERMRATPTYLLRLLTCLTSDVTFCLSEHDKTVLEAFQPYEEASCGNPEWGAYSIAFQVEQQRDAEDGVDARVAGVIPLPFMAKSPRRMALIKGTFPALMVVTEAPARTTQTCEVKSFITIRQLCDWVAQCLQCFDVTISPVGWSASVEEAMLQRFGVWPTEKLRASEDALNQEMVVLQEECATRAAAIVEEYREHLHQARRIVFRAEVVGNPPDIANAIDVIRGILQGLQKEVQLAPPRVSSAVLNLPLRLNQVVKHCYLLYLNHDRDALDAALTNASTMNLEPLSENTTRQAEFSQSGQSAIESGSIPEIPGDFCERLNRPLEQMSDIWWSQVTIALQTYQRAATQRLGQDRMCDLQHVHADNRHSIIHDTFSKLLDRWSRSHENNNPLCVTVEDCFDGKITCRVLSEVVTNAHEQVQIWCLSSRPGENVRSQLEELGTFDLGDGEKLLQVFSVQTRSVLVVSCQDDKTIVRRIEFSRGSHWQRRYSKSHHVRELGRAASMCDYDPKERLLMVGNTEDSLCLYRLNERLSSMEVMRSVDLATRTSLSLPLESALLIDGHVHMIDCTGSLQSVNVSNLRTSRKQATTMKCTSDHALKRSRLLAVDDGTCLCWLEYSSQRRMPPRQSHLRFFALDDMRELPLSRSPDIPSPTPSTDYCQGDNDLVFVMDIAAKVITIVALKVTLRSDSYRIQSSDRAGRSTLAGEKSGVETAPTVMDHWLWCLYHLYEKFPVQSEIERQGQMRPPIKLTLVCDLLECGNTTQLEERCVAVLGMIMKRLEQLNKPLYGMDLPSALSFCFDQHARNASAQMRIAPKAVSTLLRELITFVPVQICRAEYNSLTLLRDGKHIPPSFDGDSDSTALDASRIAQTLRFGLISPLLQSWRRRCVVITSMGKQSTGKSYFLNHLTGTSFAIAGARCTDGAWMSVRLASSGVLLVVIDFEGLGSFERTEQEDVFLSVLNASVSMLTIFRMEMRLDKEIDELFSKFQKGSQLIKNDSQLFRGKLYMSVKDVNPNDQRGVVDEFGAKFQRLLKVNKHKNFLSDMYAGQLEINCSPPLGTVSYYRSLAHATRYIDRQLCSNEKAGFPSGKAFLDCIRLLLAKISILDWTSLNETAQKFKIAELSNKLQDVLRYGCLPTDVQDGSPEDLVDAATGDKIMCSFDEVCATNISLASGWRDVRDKIDVGGLEDEAFDLGVCGCAADPMSVKASSRTLHSIFKLFVSQMDKTTTGWIMVQKPVQSDFDAFLSFVVRRRCLRVQKWCHSMFAESVPDAWVVVEQQTFGSLQTRLVRCLDACSQCRLGCLKASAHVAGGDRGHDCGTNHACADVCLYCHESGINETTSICAQPAGHEGRCECARGDHTCHMPCPLQAASSCSKVCSKKAGHPGNHHRCSAGLHKCGQPCVARGCGRECVVDVEVPHQVHKCEVDRCVSPCVMDGCPRACSSSDHFHGNTEVKIALAFENAGIGEKTEAVAGSSDRPTIHMCREPHACPELCVQAGICHIDVFLKQSSKTFVGARGTFQYTFQEMNGSRKQCGIKLQAGQTTHAGSHSCCKNGSSGEANSPKATPTLCARVRHYCDTRCPCCSYFCQKEHGHSGLHSTSHGNMQNTIFVSDLRDIDLMDRKYAAGESGTAEMCNLYCSKMGRGHVHYLECEQGDASTCVYTGSAKDMRRHCRRSLEPTPEREQDEVLHHRFWDSLGWEDPCASAEEREEFGKCAYKCDALDHDGKKPSYCVLNAWHAPASKSSNDTPPCSFIDGHKFECSHVSTSNKMHHVFVLDASGSMDGAPWQNLLAAVGDFAKTRIALGATGDVVSIVTFGSTASIIFESQDIVHVERAHVPYTGGGTSFGAGLRTACEVLSRMAFDAYKPVLVLFSDGKPCDLQHGEQLADHIAHSYGKHGLEAFVVGFGLIDLSVLQRIAKRLGGIYCNALTGSELKTAFHSISASLGTRASLALTKPVHDTICVICQKELSSEATHVLSPCQHELHTRCLDRLMQTNTNGKVKNCPMCRQAVTARPGCSDATKGGSKWWKPWRGRTK